jgi:exodeoxyribonuclease-3
MFKIATWNVNSIRARFAHVVDFLAQTQPDVLALQETKVVDAQFPAQDLHALGYRVVYAGQKSYNGVALLTRHPVTNIVVDIPTMQDAERRILAALHEDIRIVNLYVPNGEHVFSAKFKYKLNWLDHIKNFLKDELEKYPHCVVMGDFNIAPQVLDVYDPQRLVGKVLFSDQERNAFKALLGVGFVDSYRHLDQGGKMYSWWDYRMNAFKRNLGLRIDHILVSPALMAKCERCYVDTGPRGLERPSDHAPVIAEFTI